MANQQFNLFELKAGLCRHSVVRRLFQFWKAQNCPSAQYFQKHFEARQAV
ncbi:hypothetical protein HID58_053892 [Brassica napus]|uniref:Uncharacterized protein n=1 Tax=Brassica napus TaxID=3708 RepID=A0ABQ8AGD4_BRANA|nr:hypothetical protein HID58_053892 [Brassica napus]